MYKIVKTGISRRSIFANNFLSAVSRPGWMASASYRRRGELSVDATDGETVVIAIIELFVNLVIRFLFPQVKTYFRRNS